MGTYKDLKEFGYIDDKVMFHFPNPIVSTDFLLALI